jgi:1,4-alpha-glucan branching enzyme
VVVANFANRSYNSYTIGFPRSGCWKVIFNSDWSGYSSDFGSHLGYDTEAVLSPGWPLTIPMLLGGGIDG